MPHYSNTSKVEFFNLDVIICVGYRVKSQRGTAPVRGPAVHGRVAPPRPWRQKRVEHVFQVILS
jgi:hypothetical protein